MPSPESKNTFASLRDSILAQNGKEYWRSIEEHADTPEFKEFISQEYPHEIEEWDNSLSRRNFVKVMGASLALAGLSGCVIQPPEKIVANVREVEGNLPGKPKFFATAMSLGGVSTGLLAKAYEHRPVKVEGNPDHPGSRGGTDVLTQASVLGMYDPDRSQEITFRGSPKNWEAFIAEMRIAIEDNRKDGGAGIRFLTETVTSPTLIDQFAKLKAELPGAKWVQYEPINTDNAMAGAKLAFGSPVQSIYKYDKAERILSLDADIFSGFNVAYIKDFAKGRAFNEEKKEINRLYSIETTVSLTGAKADHRLAVKPSQMAEIAKAVAKAVGVAGATSTYTDNANWIAAMAKDLMEHKGKSLVVAGDNQSPVVHALAHAMNAALGNAGQTVVYTDPMSPGTERTQVEQFRELIGDIDAGRVKMIVILGGNPVYNAPSDLKLTPVRMNKIATRVHLGLYQDETAEYCHWHVAEKHYFEGWSDGRAYDGTASIIQPIIAPLYDGKNAHEVVQLFFKENFDKKDYDIVKAYWQAQNITAAAAVKPAEPAKTEAKAEPKTDAKSATPVDEVAKKEAPKAVSPAPAAAPVAATSPKSFDDNWSKAIHDGFIPNTAAAAKSVTVTTAFLSQPEAKPTGSGTVEITILPDPCVYDGRFVNNGWLQELPNPLNKITWDNVALVSPKTAAKLGINTGNDAREFVGGAQGTSFINTKGGNQFSDLFTVKYQGADISKPVPMWITPGQPDDVITLFMGYGRTRAGKVGTGIGYSAFDVRRSDAMNYGFGEIVARAGETTTIASTQIHFNMEGRDLLRMWDLDAFEADPEMGHQHNEYDKSMYPYEQHTQVYDQNTKWAMSIDLNSCVGCNACVVACQAENNIPVVGKEQVNRSREMHWLRIDAYFGGGDINDPDGPYFQPVLCMQCEQAPCEVVCPVHATVHSAEGLNDMVYNRCVGTRYCSNNCPYKVRRFNFLLYQDWNTPQYKLMRNPEVSIRSRGVMEKCTYCTQRIAAARIESQKDGARKIRDGEVITACQSACPTDAIIFGDMGDPESMVSKAKKDHRNYTLLNELNTQPRTTYMAGLKNQNKEMPDYRATEKRAKPAKKAETTAPGGEAH
ncbi:MAG: TAT-variant-translocated molybdopterin oxidoreductase [Pyrinomonadaceae bacterium]|nr:TAT-variant-translocated molybdopterin oxidoreductase [Pyrinomonadaceae bacterium]MBP6212103.1 TAT-variant-translocated molybdopterin oxidoreductase [Pyrinomonadaceae bacterium]